MTSYSQHGFVKEIISSQTHSMRWQSNGPLVGVAVGLLWLDLSKAFDAVSENSVTEQAKEIRSEWNDCGGAKLLKKQAAMLYFEK